MPISILSIILIKSKFENSKFSLQQDIMLLCSRLIFPMRSCISLNVISPFLYKLSIPDFCFSLRFIRVGEKSVSLPLFEIKLFKKLKISFFKYSNSAFVLQPRHIKNLLLCTSGLPQNLHTAREKNKLFDCENFWVFSRLWSIFCALLNVLSSIILKFSRLWTFHSSVGRTYRVPLKKLSVCDLLFSKIPM